MQGNRLPPSRSHSVENEHSDVSVAFGSVPAIPGGHRSGRPVKAHHVSPVRRLLRQRPVSFRWPPVRQEASAEMIKWQHHVAICASVVAYGQFDAPNEERAHMTLDLTPDQRDGICGGRATLLQSANEMSGLWTDHVLPTS
jgi:hypothetical protein